MATEHDIHRVPHYDVPLIKSIHDELTKAVTQQEKRLAELTASGSSDLYLHDPVSNEAQCVLANTTEIMNRMKHEINLCEEITIDVNSGKINVPTTETMIGLEYFSHTPLWGTDQSRKTKHDAQGATAKFSGNAKGLKAKRVFSIQPIPDVSDAVNLPAKDKLAMQILTGFSEITGLKAKLASRCALNARFDKHVDDVVTGRIKEKKKPKAKVSDNKDEKTEGKDFDTETTKKMLSADEEGVRTLDQLKTPTGRGNMMKWAMSSDNMYVVPWRITIIDGVQSWKIETSVPIVSSFSSQPTTKAEIQKNNNNWDIVCRMRLHELKKQYRKEKILDEIDAEKADIAKYDVFLDTFKNCMKQNNVPVPHHETVKVVDARDNPVQMHLKNGTTRPMNYKEYAGVMLQSLWSGSIMRIQTTTNAGNGFYSNPRSVQMVTPAHYVYSLPQPGYNPRLFNPTHDIFKTMQRLTTVAKGNDHKFREEAEVDMDMTYEDEEEQSDASEKKPKNKRDNPDEKVSHLKPDFSDDEPEPPAKKAKEESSDDSDE